MEIDLNNGMSNYMKEKESRLVRYIEELKTKMDGISFDEEGNLVGSFDEFNPYFLRGMESSDVFKAFIIPNDVITLEDEIASLEKKKAENKVDIELAKGLLKEVPKAIKQKDEEIQSINVRFLNAKDSDLENLRTELDAKRAERETLLSDIDYFNAEIDKYNAEIVGVDEKIKGNKSAIKDLKTELQLLKQRKNKPASYMNTQAIKNDIQELKEKETELVKLRGVIDSLTKYENFLLGKEETEDLSKGVASAESPVVSSTIPADEAVLPSTITPTPVEPFGPSVASAPVESFGSTVAPYPIEPFGPPVAPAPVEPILQSRSDDFHIPGKDFDFLEKFKYYPGEQEKELNKDYNGDVNTLISHEKDRNNRFRSNRIVVKIREIASSIVANIRKTNNKNFEPRHEMVAEGVVMEEDTPKVL